jgi:mannosylglucosylglycerate synthase
MALMKSVGILHYAAPPVVGGVEITIYHQARLLAEAGFQPQVIAGRGESFHSQTTFHQIPGLDSRNPEVLRVGGELAQGMVTDKFKTLEEELYQQLRPILAACQVCIVHNAVTLHKNLPLTSALKRISEARITQLIAWCHDFAWQDALYTPDLHHGWPWDLLKTPWPGVPYVAVSEHRRERLAALLGVPTADIRVITPGVDENEFLSLPPLAQDLARRLNLFQADPLVLLPARITRRKNIEFAIQVMAELIKYKPAARLLITGPPGPHNPKNQAYLEALKTLQEQHKLASAVCFLYEHGDGGSPLHLSDEVIAGLFRISDVLLFPSKREGFGIPVLEAGLGRIPVFAADIPPMRESAGELAYLFDPSGDPGSVAEAIRERLEYDQAYRLRKRVLDRFTWHAIVENQIIPLLVEAAHSEI